MFQELYFCGAFVDCQNFGFTGTGYLILTDLFPCNMAARVENEKTREREKFEQLKKSAFFDCTAKLTTPVGVTEVCELVEF